MIILWIASGLLLLGVLIKLILLKNDIRQLGNKLSDIVHTDTNARLTTNTTDRDMLQLVQSVNITLAKRRADHMDAQRTEAELKRAITNISHDLRTPLTSARGYLQMLESPELDPETRAHYLTIIRERLHALSPLMDSLFEFARVVEGDLTLDLQKVNVSNALYDALSASYVELESRGFRVELDIPEEPVTWICDPEALRRILENLLKNAATHGRSKLHVRLNQDGLTIANKVNAQNELDPARLFDRFYTADASRSNKSTGLGLAIVKELVERMNGKISASREDELLIMQLELPRE